MQKASSNSAKFLSSPISFGLISLWILNDHLGKPLLHNELTGKISDITGLIVFPFLLTTISVVVSYGTLNERILFLFANLSIVILFSIINWNQDWNNGIYSNFFGNQNGTADKTDLLCIPFCLSFNFYFYRKYSAKENTISTTKKILHVIAIILSTVAFINTSALEKKPRLERQNVRDNQN